MGSEKVTPHHMLSTTLFSSSIMLLKVKITVCYSYFYRFFIAFDIIDHKIILSKQFSNSVHDIAYSLMESYLSDCKQYVNILGEKWDLQNVIYGIPQGSCLGPLLFWIYITDICNISDKAEFILFADDTIIFVNAETAFLIVFYLI